MAEPADKGEAGGGGVPWLGCPHQPPSLQRGAGVQPGQSRGGPASCSRLLAPHPASVARLPIPPFQFDSIRPPRSEACLL